MNDDQQQQHVHGVVIISLPPADDPSKGKTITAFAYSDPIEPGIQNTPPPPRLSPPFQHRRYIRISSKEAAASFLGFVVVSLSLWLCFFSETPFQLLQSQKEPQRQRDENTFLFPLYPKNPDVRLGSAKVRGSGIRVNRGQGVKVANSSVVFPIRGNVFPDGQYYTSIVVGNPPRPFFLDVDTGSDLTWIQCDAPCTSCAKGPHPLYKPTKDKIVPSKDYLCTELQKIQNFGYFESSQQCDYEIEYADSSSSMGVLARDEMNLIKNGDKAKLSFVFGCAYDQQGQLLASPAKTDGILGLSSSMVSLPSQLSDQGVIRNVIGHCVSSEPHLGGYMFLGDDYVPRWSMTYTSALNGQTNYYKAEVLKVSYGKQYLIGGKWRGNSVQLVFDTGSSYTYFTNDAYTRLVASLKDVANELHLDDSDPAFPVCWHADFPIRSVQDVKQYFQPIMLDFGRKWWEMPKAFTILPEGYLLMNDKGNVCLGIQNGSEVLDGSIIILGVVSLRGKLFVYDNVQKKIGWVQSDCAKPQKPRGFPFFF